VVNQPVGELIAELAVQASAMGRLRRWAYTQTLMTCFPTSSIKWHRSRPITLVLPLSAGSGPVSLLRFIGQKLSVCPGQPVVVEATKSGAGTMRPC
jgi:tripartite-type tricarboxylate transporter receptor subunit TctC